MRHFGIWAFLAVSMDSMVVAQTRPSQVWKSDQVVVATVEGQPIFQSELDQIVGETLLPFQTDLYNHRRAVLERHIENILLAQEAAARKITVDELLRAEVNERTPPVSEHEALAVVEATPRAYQWLSNAEGIRLASEDLHQRRQARRRSEFVAELRSKYRCRISLGAPRLTRPLMGEHRRGQTRARVSIVEFSDFQCPYCSAMSATLDRLLREYPEELELSFKHFPLPMHPQATKAAEAAACAGEQGKFWEMHRILFLESALLASGQFEGLAATAGLDSRLFKECFSSQRHSKDWQSDRAEGGAAGVSSTPTVFINGRMISGARTYEGLRDIVEEEIRSAQSGSLDN